MKKDKLFVGRKGQKGSPGKYDTSFKRMVASEYHSGRLSSRELARKYNIPSRTVCYFADLFSSELCIEENTVIMTEQEQKDFDALSKENEALKKKLEFEQMRSFALETMADLAKTELGIDIRKNSGAKQPKE